MKLPRSRLDCLISIGAISLSAAVLICLPFVFVSCSSPSSPRSLYFMRVDLTDFPKLDNLDKLVVRDSIGIHGVGIADVSESGRNAVDGVASSALSSADEASSQAASAASTRVKDQLSDIKSHLFQYYSVGLLGYCKSRKDSRAVCSDPRASFSFDLLGILDSTPTGIDELLPNINRAAISGYQKLSRAVVILYITGTVTTVLSLALGVRRMVFSRGRLFLATFCTLSSLFITIATVGVTIMYGLLTAAIKEGLHSVGIEAVLGVRAFMAAWLAACFSIGSTIVWAVQLYCCCI